MRDARATFAQLAGNRRFRPVFLIPLSVIIAALAFAGGQYLRGSPDLDSAARASSTLSQNAPDISALSPRERAARLYDRILRYAEAGQRDSVQAFAWMALSSFQLLEGSDLDADARYDYGRIAVETGDLDIASAQADSILKDSPTHLLGLALAARVALARADTTSAVARWTTFLDKREQELKQDLAEYRAHKSDLESAANMATQMVTSR